MSAAIDTNVLVRVLVQDPTAAAQCAAAKRVVAEASASGEPLLITLCALLETEWVLRSRYKVDRASSSNASRRSMRPWYLFELPRAELVQ